jgi:hypothetical protein
LIPEEQQTLDHTRYYEIAGITLQVESNVPFSDTTFAPSIAAFAAGGPGDDTVVIRHHFGVMPPAGPDPGDEFYRKAPWIIHRTRSSWVYEAVLVEPDDPSSYFTAVFNSDHTRGDIYSSHSYGEGWRRGGLTSITFFPSDQVLLGRLVADRAGCLMHSGGLTIDGQGLMFVGHSDAGKSTTMELVRRELASRAEILCDDRNIVRRLSEGFRLHGTWSHGTVPDVSSASGPLRAILFLEQHARNELVLLDDRKEIWPRLLATLVKPLATADWWHKEMDILEQIVAQVPCYTMRFDKSGEIVARLAELANR